MTQVILFPNPCPYDAKYNSKDELATREVQHLSSW